jgi:hypothetical protein
MAQWLKSVPSSGIAGFVSTFIYMLYIPHSNRPPSRLEGPHARPSSLATGRTATRTAAAEIAEAKAEKREEGMAIGSLYFSPNLRHNGPVLKSGSSGITFLFPYSNRPASRLEGPVWCAESTT